MVFIVLHAALKLRRVIAEFLQQVGSICGLD